MATRSIDHQHLLAAARLAMRGHGGAEPNPLVGAVVVSPQGQTVGWGYHRTYGGPHAEVVALNRAGSKATGATLYCTLEPCNHTGKTPPCTEAIMRAKIARVVIARRDPNPVAAGGLDHLRAAGIKVEIIDDCEQAIAASDPFAHRVRSGLPWVTVKWAQTLDGKIADRHGQSKWISNEISRRMIHRERGRVDVILTAIGTVLKDDPMLTARDVRVRRIAKRVVIDPRLEIPLESKLVQSAREVPLVVVCDAGHAERETASVLRERGAQIVGVGMDATGIPLAPVLRELVSRLDATNFLVEAGTGLMSRLFQQKLVNEAWVFIAPMVMGDPQAKSAVEISSTTRIQEALQMNAASIRNRSGDAVMRLRIAR